MWCRPSAAGVREPFTKPDFGNMIDPRQGSIRGLCWPDGSATLDDLRIEGPHGPAAIRSPDPNAAISVAAPAAQAVQPSESRSRRPTGVDAVLLVRGDLGTEPRSPHPRGRGDACVAVAEWGRVRGAQ